MIFSQHLPPSYLAACLICIALILAAQFHFFLWIRRELHQRRNPRAELLSGLFLGAALALTLTSDLIELHQVFLPDSREPTLWRNITAVWVAGSLGAYLLALAWRWAGPAGGRNSAAATLSRTSGEISRRGLLSASAGAVMGAPFAVAGYGVFIARTKFEICEVDLKLPSLPADLEGVVIGQLTDIHAGPFLSLKEVERAAAMLNEARPDIAVITGDLITTEDDPLEGCLKRVATVRGAAGVFGCHGNHERYTRGERVASEMGRSMGIDFLRQESRSLRFGAATLQLTGVDYQSMRSPYLQRAEQWVQPGAFNVLLSHNPDVFPVAANQGYDLVIGGHTHGGQITVEIVEQWVNPGRFFTPYVSGEYRIGHSVLYVSRGIGTVNVPMRVGALPEITLLRLRQA